MNTEYPIFRRDALRYLSVLTGIAATGAKNLVDLLSPNQAYAFHDEHTKNPIKYHQFSTKEIFGEMEQPVKQTLPKDTLYINFFDITTKSPDLDGIVSQLMREHPEQPVFVFLYVDEVGNGLRVLRYKEDHRTSSRGFATIFKRLKEEYEGKIRLVAYDIGPELDKDGAAAFTRIKQATGLRSVPATFIYFKQQKDASVEVDQATCDFFGDIGKFNPEYAKLEDWIRLNVIEPAKDGTVWRFDNTPNLQKKKGK